MRQAEADRAEYLRQLRRTIATVLVPELSSAHALDAAGLMDRILAQFIVEEEGASRLSAEFGGELLALLRPGAGSERGEVTPAGFDALRADAAGVVAGADAGFVRQVIDLERRFLEQVDDLRRTALAEGQPDDGPVPPDPLCSVTAQEVTDYLRRRLVHSPDVAVERMAVVPGGRSKETILVSLSGTTELPAEVILRKDRPVGLLETRAADEFAILKAVHEFGGVPVPEPFFAESEGHALGAGTFLVMERVPGQKAGEFFPDLAAPAGHHVELGQQLAVSLARLHAMPLDRLDRTSLERNQAGVTAESTRAMVEAIMARLNGLTGPSIPTAQVAGQWLLAHAADVVPSSRLCLLQGDFGFHNMLVDGPRITALVDWEAASIGPPARELAAAWSVAAFLMGWPAFIASYLDAGGPIEDTDPLAISYYRVFLALGGLMTSKMGGHLFRTGAKRDLLTAHSGLDSYYRCSRNLARALRDAMSLAG